MSLPNNFALTQKSPVFSCDSGVKKRVEFIHFIRPCA
jgi:hypothetical protein